MGTKRNPGEFDCYAAALPDEPIFIMLARDELAPEKVRSWAHDYAMKCGIDPTPKQNRKINEAYSCADAMEKWRRENPGERRKNPRPPWSRRRHRDIGFSIFVGVVVLALLSAFIYRWFFV